MSSKNGGRSGKSQCSEKVPLCPKTIDPGGESCVRSGSEPDQIDATVVNDLSDQELYDFMAYHTGVEAADCCPDRCPASSQRKRTPLPKLESLALVIVTIIALLAVLFWWFNNRHKTISEYLN